MGIVKSFRSLAVIIASFGLLSSAAPAKADPAGPSTSTLEAQIKSLASKFRRLEANTTAQITDNITVNTQSLLPPGWTYKWKDQEVHIFTAGPAKMVAHFDEKTCTGKGRIVSSDPKGFMVLLNFAQAEFGSFESGFVTSLIEQADKDRIEGETRNRLLDDVARQIRIHHEAGIRNVSLEVTKRFTPVFYDFTFSIDPKTNTSVITPLTADGAQLSPVDQEHAVRIRSTISLARQMIMGQISCRPAVPVPTNERRPGLG
jgi:hypothetical protein